MEPLGRVGLEFGVWGLGFRVAGFRSPIPNMCSAGLRLGLAWSCSRRLPPEHRLEDHNPKPPKPSTLTLNPKP